MRIDFYHLQKQTLDAVLPLLVAKAYQLGKPIKVKIGNEIRVDFINSLLWTYSDESFLPHGSRKDGSAELQPVWLTSDDDNPNHAVYMFLVDGACATIDDIQKYERVFNIFDGNNQEAVAQARSFWKELKSVGAELHYWQQDNNGRWAEK